MLSIPILVISCDAYSDVWRPFFSIFWKRWPDCPYPVYLGSNYKIYPDERVKCITVGDDISWASGVQAMLDQLRCEYVILFLEDFLIKEPVDTAAVSRLVRIAREEQVGCLRVAPLPPPSLLPSCEVPGFPDLGIVDVATPYRVSTQIAVWRVATLRNLLVPGFSAWDFEHIGTQMSENMPDSFWGPFEATIVYDQSVEKGKWKPEGLAICKSANIEVDLGAREPFTEEELQAHYRSNELLNNLFQIKQRAMLQFRNKRRIKGLRFGLQYLTRKPFSIQMWLILFSGMIGGQLIEWLRCQNLKLKVLAKHRKYRRQLKNYRAVSGRSK
jgi:hypothetical protein